MKEVTSLEDILFNVVRPNKEGYAKDLANSYYVIDIVQPAQLNKLDTLIVIKKKLIKYGFDAKSLKHGDCKIVCVRMNDSLNLFL